MWTWILNLVAYIAVITTYFCVDGHEIIYSMYLPLDMILNLSKAVFYFCNYYLDIKERAKQKQMADLLTAKVQSTIKDKIQSMFTSSSSVASQ